MLEAGTLIDEQLAEQIEGWGVDEVMVHQSLAKFVMACARIVMAVTSVADTWLMSVRLSVLLLLRSIGEPGTQLTMRTFHIGGAASRASAADRIDVKHGGTVRLHNWKWVERSNGDLVAVSRSGALSIADEHGRERVV